MPSSVYSIAWNTSALVAGVKGGMLVYLALGTHDTANGCPHLASEPLKDMQLGAFVNCVTLLDTRIYAGTMDGTLACYDLLVSRGEPRLRTDFKKKAHNTGLKHSAHQHHHV